MQPLVDHFRRYKDVVAQIAATEELLKDPDMRELAQEELTSLERDARHARSRKSRSCSSPRTRTTRRTSSSKSAAGTGGDEAALFAVGPVPHVLALRRAAAAGRSRC